MIGSIPFRSLLHREGLVDVVGCHDVISAKLIEQAGFDCLHLGGSAVCAANYGLPDIGLVTISELIDHARRVTSAVNIPVSLDLDDGGGTPTRVFRAVQLSEEAGVGAIRIEDVDFSSGKHFIGRDKALARQQDRLRDASEFAEFITAAKEARRNPETVIIARTDAVGISSVDDAIRRANMYAEAGAEVIILCWLMLEDVERVVGEISVPLLYLSHNPSKNERDRLEQNGVKFLVRPSITYATAFRSIRDALAELRSSGELAGFERPPYAETAGAVDTEKWTDIARRLGMIQP